MTYHEDDCLTLIFSDEQDEFISRASYRAQHLFALGRSLYSVPLKDTENPVRHGVFEHGAGEPGVYYERRFPTFFEVMVLGGDPDQEKIFDNLELSTTRHFPLSVAAFTQDSDWGYLLVNSGANIIKRNADYVNGRLYMNLPMGGDQISPVRYGSQRLRGRWARIKVAYQTGVPWRITLLQTAFQPSFG